VKEETTKKTALVMSKTMQGMDVVVTTTATSHSDEDFHHPARQNFNENLSRQWH
jgi:molybdopterin biosynthesis enzyme